MVALLASGCLTVTSYQPLVSLQRPVVVDPQVANFEGQSVLVRCVPGDALPPADAQSLCRKLGTLFRNQGAQVEMQVPRNGGGGGGDDDEKKADLVLDVKSRLLHDEDSTLLTWISASTLTLVPTYQEQSFAQDVTIRDSSGSLLASDSLQSRFVTYGGLGVWAVNWILDLLIRPPEEELTGDVAKKEFSKDLYGQLSQLMFNAQVRSRVLRSFEAPPPGPDTSSSPQKLQDTD